PRCRGENGLHEYCTEANHEGPKGTKCSWCQLVERYPDMIKPEGIPPKETENPPECQITKQNTGNTSGNGSGNGTRTPEPDFMSASAPLDSGFFWERDNTLIKQLEEKTPLFKIAGAVAGNLSGALMKLINIFNTFGDNFVPWMYSTLYAETIYNIIGPEGLSKVISPSALNTAMESVWNYISSEPKLSSAKQIVLNQVLGGIVVLFVLDLNSREITMFFQIRDFDMELHIKQGGAGSFKYNWYAKGNLTFKDGQGDYAFDMCMKNMEAMAKINLGYKGKKSWKLEFTSPYKEEQFSSVEVQLGEYSAPGSLRHGSLTVGVEVYGGNAQIFSAAALQMKIEKETYGRIDQKFVTHVISEFIRLSYHDYYADVAGFERIIFYASVKDGQHTERLGLILNCKGKDLRPAAAWLLDNVDNYIYHLLDPNYPVEHWSVPAEMRDVLYISRDRTLDSALSKPMLSLRLNSAAFEAIQFTQYGDWKVYADIYTENGQAIKEVAPAISGSGRIGLLRIYGYEV
ncbi:MAG: hypothetical protein QW728_02645, partial [Thermoplasmata archaeon]